MGQKPRAGERILRLSRRFPVARDRVFRAWTESAELRRWWGPPGYETVSAEIDLRPGGVYRLGMRKSPDGDVFYLSGRYQEVRKPEKLVYTWRWEAEPELGETMVTVVFHDRGGETEVIITHEGFPTDQARDDHTRGWGGCLDRLAGVL